MGRRVEKDVDGEVTRYFHDGNQVIVEYDGSDAEMRRYVYGPGIDEPICMTVGVITYHYQFDGLGSVVALSDEDGNYQEIYSYSVFGEPNGTSLLGNPYLYTGRSYDAETGLYYYRARYYNPDIGRFLQVDPIGYSGGMNLYAYVQNDPVNYVDPLGLCKEGNVSNNSVNSVPIAPPNVDINANIATAELIGPGGMLWFYNQVNNRGPWDYKQQGSQYEGFGNFNYGATGAAIGFSDQILLRMAGFAQTRAGTSQPQWGGPLNINSGPYGDDPGDQVQIKAGIEYYRSNTWKP